jgi:hypothetical protein
MAEMSTEMTLVEVRDHALWIKHIHGNEGLKAELLGLRAGELVELSVDGFVGHWKKMDDGRDGRPTPGIKPIGPGRAHWHRTIQDKRGALVPISAAGLPTRHSPAPQPMPRARAAKPQTPPHLPTEALSKALSAIKSGTL